ncbi:MAG: Hsp20/alpha crystallin family protein [bacterium]|nr:Hsp20/alpha crystallin family protein [bacterium]
MVKKVPSGQMDEIFEILVASYAQKSGGLPPEGELCWHPATDAYETEDAFVVQMDLAGMDPQKIEVLADEHSLLVRGIRPETPADGKKHYHKMEISIGPFSRRVPLSVEVDPNEATAIYRNGFLIITFSRGSSRDSGKHSINISR